VAVDDRMRELWSELETERRKNRESADLPRRLAIKNGGPDDIQMNERVAVLETEFRHVREILTEIRADMRELRSEVRGVKWWVLGTGVASVLAIAALALGLYQAGLASQANMLAAFQSGLSAIQTVKPQQ
jgi:hypothetical protein